MDRVVATWPDGAEIRRGRGVTVGDRGSMLLEYAGPGNAPRERLYLPLRDDGLDLDLRYAGLVRLSRQPTLSRRRLLWLLWSTRPQELPDTGTVSRPVVSLGYPMVLDETFVRRESWWKNLLAIAGASGALASGMLFERIVKAWPGTAIETKKGKGISVDFGNFELDILPLSTVDLMQLSPEAGEVVWRWQSENLPLPPESRSPEPSWCVVGPSCDGEILSVGSTPWEALRRCRLVMWPGEEAAWAHTWTDPGTLVLPDEETHCLFRMLGEAAPLWWSDERWEEWVAAH